VSGEIVALNEELETTPELVNEKPYGVWLFKIKPSSEEALSTELKKLMGLDQYSASAGS
jgi:glycine cleavage system H protein